LLHGAVGWENVVVLSMGNNTNKDNKGFEGTRRQKKVVVVGAAVWSWEKVLLRCV
jgi:hypothetical protein